MGGLADLHVIQLQSPSANTAASKEAQITRPDILTISILLPGLGCGGCLSISCSRFGVFAAA